MEYGLLWYSQQFISLIEFGMTPSITRVLVDFKDRVATKNTEHGGDKLADFRCTVVFI